MTIVEALQPAIILLGAGLIAALAARAVKLSPIVGFLVAGLLIGPSGFSLLGESQTTRLLAQLAVGFVLFDIGLRFSLHDMRTRQVDTLRLAPLQMMLCGLVFAGLALLFGFPPLVAGAVGAALALSSVALGVSHPAARDGAASPAERAATAVLGAQTVAGVLILVAAASVAGPLEDAAPATALAIGKAGLALVIALAAGRFIVRPLFRALTAAGGQQAFLAVSLLVALAACAATARLDLTLAPGALLAGMAVSDTPHRRVIVDDLRALRGLFVGLFFIGVGMSVHLPALATVWPVVLLAALIIVTLKTALGFVVARLGGWSLPGATQIGFRLGPGSELALVVIGLPAMTFSLPDAWASILIAAIALTLVAAPVWNALGAHVALLLAERAGTTPQPESDRSAPGVLILGMTAQGRLCADAMRDHRIPYLALDDDRERFVAAAADGYRVVHGDPGDTSLMQKLGAQSARAIFVSAPGLAESASLAAIDGPARLVIADSAKSSCPGVVADLLAKLGVDQTSILQWITRETGRQLAETPAPEETH